MKYNILSALVAIIISSCVNPRSKEESNIKDQSVLQKQKIFYSVNENTFLLTSPSESAAKIVDSLNSSPIHNEYYTIDSTVKIIIIGEKNNWKKVKVVEPVWLAERYIGWIPKRSLVAFQERNIKQIRSTGKAKNVNLIKTHLSESDVLKANIVNTIQNISKDNGVSKIDLSSLENINLALSIFERYSALVEEGNQSHEKEILEMTKILKKSAIRSQIKNFPKIRKAYYLLIKDEFWDRDINVAIGGAKNTILKLTGGYFAANLNKREIQTSLLNIIKKLRFKQCQYRWYEGQADYTYFTIESHNDDFFVY